MAKKLDYGIDAPNVIRNLLAGGGLCLVIALVFPRVTIEGVGDRTTVKSEDALQMSFPDGSFDVVLSNLCLHNIYDRPGRAKACQEIGRVLKPGGVAVISDYKHTGDYRKELIKCGLDVRMFPLDWSGTFPPLRILTARKNA